MARSRPLQGVEVSALHSSAKAHYYHPENYDCVIPKPRSDANSKMVLSHMFKTCVLIKESTAPPPAISFVVSYRDTQKKNPH